MHTRTPHLLITALLMTGVMGSTVVAEAATYYVSAGSGNDSNPGSQTQPWQTLKKASLTVVAGDTVMVGPGRYTDSTATTERAFNPTNSGTASAPITFQADPPLAAVLVAPSISVAAWSVDYKSYIVLDGFKAEGMVGFRHSDHITIQNCEVIYGSIQGTDISLNWGIIVHGTDSIVRNNYVHDMRNSGNSLQNSTGIEVIKSTRNLIENNDVDGGGGTVYSAYGQKGGDITFTTWRRNIARNAKSGFLGMGSTDSTLFSTDNAYYENVIYNMSVAAFDLDHNNQRYNIYNNTAYNVKMFLNGGYLGDDRVGNTQIQSWNNLIVTGSYGYYRGPSSFSWAYLLSYSDYNLFSAIPKVGAWNWGSSGYALPAWQTATGFDNHSLTDNPLFTDVAGYDFHLNASSPAKGRGKTGEDLGAYPTGVGMVGPTNGLWRTASGLIEPPTPMNVVVSR